MSFTGNARHPNNPPSDPPAEPTGLVAKDSLANESIEQGGGFGENVNPEVIGVKGAQSTLNNTDTTNADVLQPASSGAAREQQDLRNLGSGQRGEVGIKYPDAEAGQGFDGTHSDQGYRGGSGDPSVSGGSGGSNVISSTGASSGGAGIRPYVESAPNYAIDQTTSGDLKPKGDNLVEGGGIPPNRSTFVGDVGGPKDPSRLAERESAKVNADSSGGTGARDYGSGSGDGVGYENLNSSERA